MPDYPDVPTMTPLRRSFLSPDYYIGRPAEVWFQALNRRRTPSTPFRMVPPIRSAV
jgi:hypothetical protein